MFRRKNGIVVLGFFLSSSVTVGFKYYVRFVGKTTTATFYPPTPTVKRYGGGEVDYHRHSSLRLRIFINT